jgi:O-antigen/teichoic acid export membrane protein
MNSPNMSMGVKLDESEWPRYFGAILVQNAVFCVAGFVIFYLSCLGLHFLAPSLDTMTFALPLAVCTMAVQTQDLLRRYNFTRFNPSLAFLIDLIRYGGQIAVLLVLYFGWFGFHGVDLTINRVLWVITATALVSTVVGFMFVRDYTWSWRAVVQYTKHHLNFSTWLTASVLMNWFTAHLFILGGGAILGAAAMGAVKATQTLMGVCHVFFFALENFVTPRAAWHAEHSGRERFTQYLMQVTKYGGSATAVIALIAAATPEFWLHITFGAEFGEFGYVLRIHALAYLVLYFTLPLKVGLRAIEKTESVFYAEAGAAIFAMATVYVLVSGWHLTGVVVGILTVHLIQVVLLAKGMKDEMRKAFPDSDATSVNATQIPR